MRVGRVLGALALTAVLAACTSDDDPSYDDELVRYDDETGEENRFVDLPGGGQLSVGSPDRHRVVVQWKDDDGSGWTEPETVWVDDENTIVENTVREAAGTVAIRQLYTSDPGSDQDTGTFDIGIVCRELACETTAEPGFAGEAQVTADGRYVLLGDSEEGAVLWTEDEGIRLEPWTGHPGHNPYKMTPSTPVLAPDGSIRVVGADHPSGGTCTYELYVGAEPGSAQLTRVAEATLPVNGNSAGRCATYLVVRGPDRVHVRASDLQTDNFSFERRDGAWRPSFEVDGRR